MRLFIKSIFVFTVLSLLSCTQSSDKTLPKYKKATKQDWVEANKILAEKETELIESFINRRHWKMTKCDIGIWIEKTSSTNNKTINKGNKVTYSYSLELLDGTTLSSSDENKPETVIIGSGKIIRGLDYAFRQLKLDEEAKIIIPSHLGYGLLGDQKTIPPRAILYYQIKILTVE